MELLEDVALLLEDAALLVPALELERADDALLELMLP